MVIIYYFQHCIHSHISKSYWSQLDTEKFRLLWKRLILLLILFSNIFWSCLAFWFLHVHFLIFLRPSTVAQGLHRGLLRRRCESISERLTSVGQDRPRSPRGPRRCRCPRDCPICPRRRRVANLWYSCSSLPICSAIAGSPFVVVE